MDGLPRVRRRDLKLVRLSFVAVQEASKTVASYYRIREDCFRPAGFSSLSSNIAHTFASNQIKIVLAQMIYYPTVLYQFLKLISTALVPCICTFQFPKIRKKEYVLIIVKPTCSRTPSVVISALRSIIPSTTPS
jgi:hypothetical protein